MSHFSVLVIGDNPETQLAPYHEFESTGMDNIYVQDVDITEEVLSYEDENGVFNLHEALSYEGLENLIVEDGCQIDKTNEHKYGYAIVKDGKLIKAVKRTNPNSKWDWYQLGGRWSNFFLLKDGDTTSIAKKKYIDFNSVISKERIEAESNYKSFQSFLSNNNLEFPKTWAECRKEYKDIEEARKFYNSQPAVKLIEQDQVISKLHPMLQCPFDYFGKSKEDFIKRETESCCVTYAVIKDSQWYSKGEMGWFGMSNDAVSQDNWNKKFWELVNSASEDETFSLYDCHI